MGVATFIHNYTTDEKQCNLLFGALQASKSLCKHGQKEEAYTKKTISTHNWRVSKELAVFEGAQSFSQYRKFTEMSYDNVHTLLQLSTNVFAVYTCYSKTNK